MVKIDIKDWNKLQGYAKMAYNGVEGHDISKCEISGILIAFKEDNDIILKHPCILEQTVSGGNCILDKAALAQYYTESCMKYGTDIRFVWWHSHHMMSAFWSSTDLTAIEEFNLGDYSMSLVINLKEEYKFRINWWKPAAAHIDTELKIIKTEQPITTEMIADFKSLVTKIVVPETKALSRFNSWAGRYKQPNNYGPGLVDATLMDTEDTIYDKYLDIADDCLEEIYGDLAKEYEMFLGEWKKIQNSAIKDGIEILDINEKEFNLLKGSRYANATEYVKPASGSQQDLWRSGNQYPVSGDLWRV
jgi:hypothetical protein